MPLNEHEDRILQEIEQRFYDHDPESARRIDSTTLPRYLARNCRWALLGFLLGLIVLVFGLPPRMVTVERAETVLSAARVTLS